VAAEIAPVPRRAPRFTPSATHQLVERPDKFHLAMVFSMLRIRRAERIAQQLELEEAADEQPAND
jgi:hypothetical protein